MSVKDEKDEKHSLAGMQTCLLLYIKIRKHIVLKDNFLVCMKILIYIFDPADLLLGNFMRYI